MPFVRGHRRSRTQSEIDPLTACGVTLSQPPSSHSLSKDVVAVACSSHNFDSFRTFPSIPNKTPSFRNTICVPAVSVSLKVIPSLATIPEPRLEVDSKAAAVANVTKLSEVVLDESSSDSKNSLKGKDMLHDEKLRLFRFPSSISFTSTKVETTSSGNVISLSQSTSTISTLSSIIFPTSSIKATNLANSSNSEKLSKGGDVNLSAEFSSDHGTTLVRDVARLTEELLSRDQEENDGNDVNALSPGESPQQQPPNIAAEKGDQSILKNNDSLSIHESSLVNDHGNKLIVSDNLITKLEMMVPEASFLTSSSSPNSVNYSKINNDETADTATSLSKLLNQTAEKTKAKTKELSAVIRQEKKQGILLMVEKSLKRRLSNASGGGGGTCLDGTLTKSAQLVRQEEFKKSHSCSTPVACKFPPSSYGFGLSNNYWAAARSPSIVA